MNDKLLAIRYIIYRVAQEFNKYHKKEANDLVYFNENNNFTLEKCLLLPYIITIANGNKNFFLEGVFENSFIPCLEENDLKVLIGNNLEDNFEIYTQESLNLQFNENGFLIFNFNPEEFVFQTDLEKEKENTLNFNINYSIKFFIERRYSNFAILDEKILKKITYQNSAFDLFKNYFSDIDVTQIELVENFNLVAIESFYFTYLNERIEEDIDVTQF